MKRLLLGISVVALMLTTSCGNNAEQERIAQLEKELAKSKEENRDKKKASIQEDASPASSSENGSETPSSSDDLTSTSPTIIYFEGTYKFTDKANQTWTLILNKDKTAQIKRGNELHYGSWTEYASINVMYISFDYDDAPMIYFPFGSDRGTRMSISKDGYIYEDTSAEEAKNPRKRLPIKKVNSSSSSENGSEASSSSDNLTSTSPTIIYYEGTYKFTDKANQTWTLTLNKDKTAQIKRGNELHYGSWEESSTMYIRFDYEDAPMIYFPFGPDRGTLIAISKDGYIYESIDAKEAKNPRKRLPIKKIK